MIPVTDLHGHRVFINIDKIELIEENPETQLLLTSGRRFYVQECADELAARMLAYRQKCFEGAVVRLKAQKKTD